VTVGDQKTQSVKQSFYGFMKMGIPWGVSVAVYCLYGGYEGQFPKDLLATYIARVKDDIYPCECIVHLGTKETVSVGDESDDVRHL
jgi:hypothetical protein